MPSPTHVDRRTLLAGSAAALGATLAGRPLAASAADVSFDAGFATNHLSKYLLMYPAGVIEGIDYGIISDPSGSTQKVAFFSNHRGLTHGNSTPRSAAESPRIIRPLSAGATNDVYVHYLSFYLPTPPSQYTQSDGLTLATPAYGPPFGGGSPLNMTVFPIGGSKVRVLLGPSAAMLGADFALPVNTWNRVVLQFKFAYNGWVRMWVGTGLTSRTWRSVPLHGKTTHYMSTMAPGVNDAISRDPRAQANSSRIGAYGWKSRVFYGHHGITQRLSVIPGLG